MTPAPAPNGPHRMAITLHTPETIYSARHVPSWLLLSAAAGAVNGTAFLMCEQFVTHVTGTITRIGLEWPHTGIAAEYLVVLVGFLAGSASSVVAIQARVRQGKQPRWATPLVWVAAILVGTALAGAAGAFGPFGGIDASDPPPSVLLTALAFAMGLQNAVVALTTGLAVRTTHLTGPTTDLGIHLGTACLAAGEERRAALRGAALRAGKIVAFLTGAGLALPLAEVYGFLALLAPAGFILMAAGMSFVPDWGPSDFPEGVGKAPAGMAASPDPGAG